MDIDFDKAKLSNDKAIKRRLELIFQYHENSQKIKSSLKSNIISRAKYGLVSEEKKITKVKEDLFLAGLIYDYTNESVNSTKEYWFPTDVVSYILMADNQKLNKILYDNCRYTLSKDHIWKTWIIAMLQISCNAWEAFEKTYLFFTKDMQNTENVFFNTKLYIEIFEGFLNNDKKRLELSLNKLEESKMKTPRIKSDIFEKYISPQTITIGKLAWMHGMEVEIDSKYVPKELLPFKPLEEYTIPYKFLRDFYRKQGLDWRYDPVHPELQNWENDPENPDRKKGGLFGKLFN